MDSSPESAAKLVRAASEAPDLTRRRSATAKGSRPHSCERAGVDDGGGSCQWGRMHRGRESTPAPCSGADLKGGDSPPSQTSP